MRQHELAKTILDAFAELATLHAAAAAASRRAWSALAQQGEANLGQVPCDHCQLRQPSADRPLVNVATFSVAWHGRRCDLGPTILFRLIQRLLRRSGCYCPYEILMDDVWERRCSNSTVRGAVKRLRRALCDAGMRDLADAIQGHGQCYGIFLDGGAV